MLLSKKCLLVLTSFLAVSAILACGPKQLTDARAKELTQQRLDADKKQIPIDYTAVSQLIEQPVWANLDDLTPEQAQSNPQLPKLQQLGRAGMLTTASSEGYVADLTGDYTGSMTRCFSVQLSLQMNKPPYVEGTYNVQNANYCWPRPADESLRGGRVIGVVSPAGQLSMDFQPALASKFSHADFTVAAFASFTELRGTTGSWPISVTRMGDLSLHTLKQFTYSLSPSAAQLVTEPGKLIAGGGYQVSKLNNLLLAGETSAEAEFEWTVALNAFATAVTGEPTVTGTGKAEFGKQPDGEWVLTDYYLSGQ